MKDKLLIVGGTGFIGYNLAKKSKELDYEVTCISSKYPPKVKRLNNVNYLICDITKKKNITSKLKNLKFDYVINLSGYVDHSKKVLTYKTHYLGAKYLIDFFSKKKIFKFIQVGNSLEYGNLKNPNDEKDTNLNLKLHSCYSNSKLKTTKYLFRKFKKDKFPFIVIRPYLVYGPGQDFNRVIPIIIRAALNNQEFECTDGKQKRDFLYIDDLVSGIIKSLKVKNKAEIINIGYGKPYSIKYVINKIIKHIGKGKPLYGLKKIRKDENLISYPKINKAKKFLNWQPKIDFKKGIINTINYYKNEK